MINRLNILRLYDHNIFRNFTSGGSEGCLKLLICDRHQENGSVLIGLVITSTVYELRIENADVSALSDSMHYLMRSEIRIRLIILNNHVMTVFYDLGCSVVG